MSKQIVSTWACLAIPTGHGVSDGCGAAGDGDERTVDLAAAKHQKLTKHATVTRHRVKESTNGR